MNEVRVVADSVVANDGVAAGRGADQLGPAAHRARLAVGDEVEVTADGFERLAAAYLAAIEATYAERAG